MDDVLSGIKFQRPFASYLWLLCLVLIADYNQASELSLADRKLLKIIDLEKAFFAIDPNPSSDAKELNRKAQDIVSLYEAFISENPDDTNAMILYGKFLNKIGQENHAIGFFLKADEINPKIAVVKQQIGNFLVENNKPIDALPFFTATVEINPSIPEYHFHLGNFLHLFEEEISGSGILEGKTIESFAHECFGQAAQKKPNSFEYRLRFAQSFFDLSNANYYLALKEWDKLKNDFEGLLSKPEIDYIKLCKARVLLELNQKVEATSLIDEVSTKSLVKSKKVLLDSIKNKSKNNSQKVKSNDLKKTGYLKILTNDPHIARLKQVTKRLIEENLIKQLDADQIQVRHDADGNPRLIVNQNLYE